MPTFDAQALRAVEERLGIWPVRLPTMQLIEPPDAVPNYVSGAWELLCAATEGKGGDPLNLYLRAVALATGADFLVDARRQAGLESRAELLFGLDALELHIGKDELVRRTHALACRCRDHRVLLHAPDLVLRELGGAESPAAFSKLPAALRRVALLLRERCPEFVSESDIEQAYASGGESGSKASTIISMLKTRHHLPVESAQQAQRRGATVTGKGYRWVPDPLSGNAGE